MAQDSSIEWTDATWNPVRGCSRVSPGCGGANHQGGCYAEKIAARFSGPGLPYEGLAEPTPHGGRWTGAMRLVPELLDEPFRWSRPRKIFVNSMSDLFHENLPDAAIDQVMAVIALSPRHVFQVLTKRSARARRYMNDPKTYERILRAASAIRARRPKLGGIPISDPRQSAFWPQLWLGVSVEDQLRADERIPDLLATPAAVRFLSCEPLLGPVDLEAIKQTVAPGYFGDCLRWYHQPRCEAHVRYPTINWVICGGESGKGDVRPMHPEWPRTLRDQCVAAGIPFFFKQWGEWAPGESALHPQTRTEKVATWADGEWLFGRQTLAEGAATHRDDEPDLFRFGKKRSGRHLDGQVWDQFPEVT